MKPNVQSIDLSELHALAHETIKIAKFPMLATAEKCGQPRVRPISPVRVDADFTIYVANLASYEKTGQIAANPKVELAYLAPNHDQVRISGKAEHVNDRNSLKSIWQSNPLLKRYLGTIDNPEFILYRIIPTKVVFMREWALEYHNVPIHDC